MKFCTRCGLRLADRERCPRCGAVRGVAVDSSRTAEHPPAGDLPPFVFGYTERTLLSLVERKRELCVAFSHISGTLLEVSTHEDAEHSVDIRLWSQSDDPQSGPRPPIVAKESQPSFRSIVKLKLGSGAERSFVLTQVRLGAGTGNRVTLIFPVSVERALNPIYDYAAIAAVDHPANDYTWSTTHPEIHALRDRLPADQDERFTDALSSYLNGLCRRCLRLFRLNRERNRRCRIQPQPLELVP
jgi:hypothetical protein